MKLDKASSNMSWLQRSPSLKLELALGFGVVIALVLVLGVAAYLSQERSVFAINKLLTVDNRTADLSLRSALAMHKARRAESDLLYSMDDLEVAPARERYEPLVQSNLTDMREYLTSIRILSTDPGILDNIKHIEVQIQLYENGFSTVLDFSRKLEQAGPEWVGKFHQMEPEIEALIKGVNGTHQQDLRNSFQKLRQHENDFTSHRNEVQLQLILAGVTGLRALLQSPRPPGAEYQRLAALLNDYAQIYQRYVEMVRAIKTAQHQYVQAALAMEPLLEDMHTIATTRAIQTRNGVEIAANFTRRTILVTASIATLLGAIVAFLVSRRITSGVTKLITFSRRVAAGDFSARAQQSHEHEFAILARAMNQMAQSLENSRTQLLATARQAGMAEIATNVLHNVGNILNSVNVSAGLVSSTLRTSKAQGLSRAVQLMDEHAADLGDFLTLDDKGRLLPGYLGKLALALTQEQQGMVEELERLTRSIDHIKEVVATQQSYAGSSSIVEPVQICDLAEDALRMNGDSLARHRITVVKEFVQVPMLRLDRARVLQILVNLISNAKNAMENVALKSRQITLRVNVVSGSSLRVSVRDEGEGIPEENLTRIFAHGFTTRNAG
ncbi:ATP-binding protein, partial [Rhodoferax ferrireducens]|uniref:ATP-binding protein n=1 Tax=Rhodoferax ferrireducens TaxID=192843 RepID=UPI001E650A84